jgi:hypothetical protein
MLRPVGLGAGTLLHIATLWMMARIDTIGGATLVGLIHADQHVQSAEWSVAIEEHYTVLAKEIPIGRIGKAKEVR